VENISPTSKQISSTTFYKFKTGSDVKKFYDNVITSIQPVQKSLTGQLVELNSGFVGDFQAVKDVASYINNGINQILGSSASYIASHNSDPALQDWINILSDARLAELTGKITTSQSQANGLLSYIYSTDLNTTKNLFANIIQLEAGKGQKVEILDTRKNDITNRLDTTVGYFNNLLPVFNQAKILSDTTPLIERNTAAERTILFAQLQTKLGLIKAQVPTCDYRGNPSVPHDRAC